MTTQELLAAEMAHKQIRQKSMMLAIPMLFMIIGLGLIIMATLNLQHGTGETKSILNTLYPGLICVLVGFLIAQCLGAPFGIISDAEKQIMLDPYKGFKTCADCCSQHKKGSYKMSSDGSVAVDPDYYWQTMNTCPRGAKVQLIGKGGVAVYGTYDGKNEFWEGWAPIPKRKSLKN